MDYIDEFHQNPIELLFDLSKCGEDFQFFTLGQEEVYFLNHPTYIEDVLVRHHQKFTKILGFHKARTLLGPGLFSRKLPWPSQSACLSYMPVIVEHAMRLLQTWQNNDVIWMLPEMKRFNFRVMADTICQGTIITNWAETMNAMDVVIDALNSFTLPFPEILDHLPENLTLGFQAAQNVLDSVIYDSIRSNSTSAELATLSHTERHDRTLTALLAGYEQTASILSWVWYFLARQPLIEKQLHNEIDEVLRGRLPSNNDLKQLRFTRNVIDETLRLYPPVWILARRALYDHEIASTIIPAGTVVFMSQYAMHRDDRYYDVPSLFRPERWNNQEVSQRPLFSYFPFGHGPRGCKGEQFVRAVCTLSVAAIAQRWRLLPLTEYEGRIEPRITLKPDSSMQMIVRERMPNPQG